MASSSGEITVFISNRESTCDECKQALGKKAWITLTGDQTEGERRAVCLECADLAHLDFLPSGDAALTRRAKKYSALTAVVLQWSKSRKRYERQGLLVTPESIEQAEEECLADADIRERRRERAAESREVTDRIFIEKFATRLRELYPAMPKGRESVIADHACRKYSGRVGRSASAKELEEKALRLAAAAHVRHAETEYDSLLMRGVDRGDARFTIRPKVEAILSGWTRG